MTNLQDKLCEEIVTSFAGEEHGSNAIKFCSSSLLREIGKDTKQRRVYFTGWAIKLRGGSN